MKRQATPLLSLAGEQALEQYEQALREQEDLTAASIRNYLSDLLEALLRVGHTAAPQHL